MNKEKLLRIADTLVEEFLPREKGCREFSFNFTIPPDNNYVAHYKLGARGDWELEKCEEVLPETGGNDHSETPLTTTG